MRPVIGIVLRVEYPGETGKLILREEYRQNVIKHGGIPMGIFPSQLLDYTKTKTTEQPELTDEEKEMIIEQLRKCDGILMPGGFKANKFDRFISEYATENDIPLLGICLGMQIMANYKKEQFWVEKNETVINHNSEIELYHDVTLDKESKLFSIIEKERFKVRSRHNYHVLPNDYYDVSALSDDNIIEAIERKDRKFNIGVQWHPEDMDDETSDRLFTEFINSCK